MFWFALNLPSGICISLTDKDLILLIKLLAEAEDLLRPISALWLYCPAPSEATFAEPVSSLPSAAASVSDETLAISESDLSVHEAAAEIKSVSHGSAGVKFI